MISKMLSSGKHRYLGNASWEMQCTVLNISAVQCEILVPEKIAAHYSCSHHTAEKNNRITHTHTHRLRGGKSRAVV